MRKITEYCRLVLFMAGVLLGVQVPSFVQDYEQNLKARLGESSLGLSEFKKDADDFFNGDIQALIDHYRSQNDEVINSGADNIAALFNRNEHLSAALLGFNESVFSPYVQTFISPLPDVQRDVWDNYDYSVVLNGIGIGWGLAFGFLMAVLVEIFMGMVGVLMRAPLKKGSAV